MTQEKLAGRIDSVNHPYLSEIENGKRAVTLATLAKIAEANIRNYSIFHRTGQLFAYFEYVGDDFDGDMARMADDPETQRWWAWMMPMQEPLDDREEGEWWADMAEVFHTD